MKYYAANLYIYEDVYITNCTSYIGAQKEICNLYKIYCARYLKVSNQTPYEFLIYNKQIIDLINVKNYIEASNLLINSKWHNCFSISVEDLNSEDNIETPIVNEKKIIDELKKRIFK